MGLSVQSKNSVLVRCVRLGLVQLRHDANDIDLSRMIRALYIYGILKKKKNVIRKYELVFKLWLVESSISHSCRILQPVPLL